MSNIPIIAIDIETTGLSCQKHKIVEIAAIKYIDNKETEIFHTLIHPLRPIPYGVQKIHGISDSMVADSPTFCEIAGILAEFLSGGCLLGHNIMFDYGFITHECKCADILFKSEYPMLDTYRIAKKRYPQLPSYKLVALKEAFGIGNSQSHRALDDVRDCKAIYDVLMSKEDICLNVQAPVNLSPQYDEIVRAMAEGRDIVIEYTDNYNNKTVRHIRPLAIYDNTLKAYCYLRKDERHFNLSRISQAFWEKA